MPRCEDDTRITISQAEELGYCDNCANRTQCEYMSNRTVHDLELEEIEDLSAQDELNNIY